jgi:pyruvate/2-oxoglutarate dehydrogenase complex dihydrolipoamide dehydrogenase (E3) component
LQEKGVKDYEPGGIGAAVAATRSGANTVLIERYGHLGGMGHI